MPLTNQPSMFPNQYYAEVIPCSTSTVSADNFGFQADYLTIINDRAAAVYVNLNSTVATTAGLRTCAGETLGPIREVPISGFGLASTTTSTSTIVRVSAVGA